MGARLAATLLRRYDVMREPSKTSRWTRHLVYRAECTRTTWKLRVGLVALVVVALWLTSGWWTVAIARSLVCETNRARSDAILIENFESSYLVFERATELRRAGLAARVLVQSLTDPDTQEPEQVALARLEVVAKSAGIGEFEIVRTRQVEPIMLNAVRDIQRFLEREHIRSVIVVMPAFRSRRSALVYAATLAPAGITVRCEPVQGSVGVNDWTRSWHGIQDVVEQWFKLQYYRLYVLPVHSGPKNSAISAPLARGRTALALRSHRCSARIVLPERPIHSQESPAAPRETLKSFRSAIEQRWGDAPLRAGVSGRDRRVAQPSTARILPA